uniref:Zgc:175222 n=4 Tax=Nothobranchius kuhntae TaxID=321403 RepID=A0A1A8JBP4_NOTKU
MPSSGGSAGGVQRLPTAEETGSGSDGNMSGEKAVGTSCSKFQPNIFNKTKCQNCFKSREVHLLSDGDMEQAKPIYASWLCLAPVGTDFTNPMQRSRKWQRRFFILYEHGSLSYALDELLSTLPQGTVNMNLCTDITDAEPRTGQKNALCITTPSQEIFIRGDNKEVINGWNEQLAVYLRPNKQNQKKKRKVEPVANQEPSPAKMAATCPSSEEAVPDSVPWQEEQHGGDVTPVWTVSGPDPSGPEWTPADNTSSYPCQASRNSGTSGGAGHFTTGENTGSDQSTDVQTSAAKPNPDRSQKTSAEQLLGLGATEKPQRDGTSICRQGRTAARTAKHENLQRSGCEALLSAPLPVQRRSRSLDRRTSDIVMTPDLLNFKKGWMMKLDEKDQWKKYWFVLSTDRLRFYRDSVAEETSDLGGEIDLTKCFSVSEYQVQRNYGFQIHTLTGTFTLSAMTAGIRRNWIQALMKNVHPGNAPDVASLPGQHITCSSPELIPKPDVTQDSASKDISMEKDPHSRTVTERRHEDHYKTFDCSEIRPQSHETDHQKPLSPLELGDLERRRRREERRRRYESMLGFSLGHTEPQQTEDGDVRAPSPQLQLTMEKQIEECWRKVERSGFIPERKVLLSVDTRDCSEVEKIHSYRKTVADLKAQLAESECCRLKLETWISTAGFYQEQPNFPVSPGALFCPVDMNEEHLKDLNKSYGKSRKVLFQQQHVRPHKQEHLHLNSSSSSPQLPSIWLKDAEHSLQHLDETSHSQQDTSQKEGPVSGLHFNGGTAHHLGRRDHQLFPASETNREFGLAEETTHEDSTLGVDASDPSVVKHLSQEVEELTKQNKALDQQNQEMINQLMEADREIERLKAELGSKLSEARLLSELKLQAKTMDDLEKQLSLRNQELLDVRTLISSLGTEGLKSAAEAPVEEKCRRSSETSEEGPLQCLQAAETKLMKVEKQLEESTQTCRQLTQQNTQLNQTGELYLQRASEAEADLKRLKEELEKQRLEKEERNRRKTDEEQILQVTEGMVTRLRASEKLLEVMDTLDFIRGAAEEQEESPDVVRQLRWEEEFWKLLLNKLKADPAQLENPVGVLLSEITERLMLETQVLLEAHELLLQTGELTGIQTPESRSSAALNGVPEPEPSMFGFEQLGEMEHLKAFTQIKIRLLERTSSIRSSTLDELLLAANRLYGPHSSPNPRPVLFLHSAAAEALFCCRLARLRSGCERRLCCVGLLRENQELKAKLSDVEERHLSFGSQMSVCCQTDEIYLQRSESQNDPPLGGQMVSGECLGEGEAVETNTEVSGVGVEVTELENPSVTDQMKEDSDQKMSVVLKQHEEEKDKLKAVCERGLAAMEECHRKVVEELRRLHQQEVERLLVEKDQLLEEESAATATAIEAIQNAHRVELQREVQRRRQSENGNTQLEEIHRQHREELASIQRELGVLSQQFSLKCLEIRHLVQALDAERRALCQCQQENQDLRSRNQELSAQLAEEITRLCSMAKRNTLTVSQGMDVYEMEITLRLKDSEVQCLQQEVASLKDELQAALKDKRDATKRYKDVLTELNVVGARGEREAEELRESLKLARQALNHTPT